MRVLSSSELLDLWERGVGLHPLDRGLTTLSVADPSASDSVADWPLGRRNRALLELHASWFGPQLQGWTACPECGEKVEFEVDTRQLAGAAQGEQPHDCVTVAEHAFRLPTSRDLAQTAGAGDVESSAVALLGRCRIGGPENPEWTDDLLEAVGESLASADPLAEMRLALNCPTCRREWNDALDIACFVWAEVEARARRVLWEVHSLASAYGWSESETLAVGAARRAIYLEMVHG
jgi:hypothetical protein